MKDLEFFAKSVIAGGMASTIAKTAVAPGERLRILLQMQSTWVYPEHYTSSSQRTSRGGKLGQLALEIIRKEGLSAMWRGNLANCLRSFPTSALRFSLFAYLTQNCTTEFRESFCGALLLGAISGGTTTLITYPLDLVRTKLAVSNQQRYKGIIDCLVQTVAKEGGALGLYRGLFISILEIMPYTAISLGGFHLAKSHMYISDGEQSSLSSKLFIGWVVGLAASLICYPVDTIKRHVMLANDIPQLRLVDSTCTTKKPLGILGCAKYIGQNKGFFGFYRGCLLNAFKSAPSAAISLVANDTLRNFMGL